MNVHAPRGDAREILPDTILCGTPCDWGPDDPMGWEDILRDFAEEHGAPEDDDFLPVYTLPDDVVCWSDVDAAKAWAEQRKWDPQHPFNLTRFHPDVTDDSVLFNGGPYVLIPVRREVAEGPIWVAVSPSRVNLLNTWKWNARYSNRNDSRYFQRGLGKTKARLVGEKVVLHRLIMREMLRENDTYRKEKCKLLGVSTRLQKELQIVELLKRGHVNHLGSCTDDNRDDRLDLTTPGHNTFQRVSVGRGACGFAGVSYYKRDSNYVVRIHLNKKEVNIGYYPDVPMAVLARSLAIMGNAHAMPAGVFCPASEIEQMVWRNVWEFLEKGTAPNFREWEEPGYLDRHPRLKGFYVAARKRFGRRDIDLRLPSE